MTATMKEIDIARIGAVLHRALVQDTRIDHGTPTFRLRDPESRLS
jgi:hypothetical protein